MVPVGDAEASVVGEVALVGSLPGDGGPGAAADLTSEGDALPAVTGHIGQRHEELWGNWGGWVWGDLRMRYSNRELLNMCVDVGILPS